MLRRKVSRSKAEVEGHKVSFKYSGSSSWLKAHPTFGWGDGEENGFAIVPTVKRRLMVVFSSGLGWEHVSVSRRDQMTPSWEEMCIVKNLFWDTEDTVVQFHPPKSKYINHHPGVLHLWRPINTNIPTPDTILIGPQ